MNNIILTQNFVQSPFEPDKYTEQNGLVCFLKYKSNIKTDSEEVFNTLGFHAAVYLFGFSIVSLFSFETSQDNLLWCLFSVISFLTVVFFYRIAEKEYQKITTYAKNIENDYLSGNIIKDAGSMKKEVSELKNLICGLSLLGVQNLNIFGIQ